MPDILYQQTSRVASVLSFLSAGKGLTYQCFEPFQKQDNRFFGGRDAQPFVHGVCVQNGRPPGNAIRPDKSRRKYSTFQAGMNGFYFGCFSAFPLQDRALHYGISISHNGCHSKVCGIRVAALGGSLLAMPNRSACPKTENHGFLPFSVCARPMGQ